MQQLPPPLPWLGTPEIWWNAKHFVSPQDPGTVVHNLRLYNRWVHSCNDLRSVICCCKYRLGWGHQHWRAITDTYNNECERFWVECKWLLVDDFRPGRLEELQQLRNDHNQVVQRAVSGKWMPWLRGGDGSGPSSNDDVEEFKTWWHGDRKRFGPKSDSWSPSESSGSECPLSSDEWKAIRATRGGHAVIEQSQLDSTREQSETAPQ